MPDGTGVPWPLEPIGKALPQRPDGRPAAHEWDLYSDPDDISALCLALGGSVDSWTGEFLHLLAKSDPEHRARLRLAAPGMVAAWQAWQEHADGKGKGVIMAYAMYRVHAVAGF